jgi:hypothetical protein
LIQSTSALVGADEASSAPAQEALFEAQMVSRMLSGSFRREMLAVQVRSSVPSMRNYTPAGVHSMSYWWKADSASPPRPTTWGSCVGVTEVVQVVAGVPV